MATDSVKQLSPDSGNDRICPLCGEGFAASAKKCPEHDIELLERGRDELLGAVLSDRYRLARFIASGGWGSIYRAYDTVAAEVVAVKILHPHLASDETQIKRFKREMEIVYKLNHPAIARVLDSGFVGRAQPFIVMEHIDGVTLDETLKTEGHLSVDRCRRIFAQACSALAEAHAKGIVHRDIKPDNIMLLKDDQVKLLDFGVSMILPTGHGEQERLSKTGEMHGSVQYMSPEQFKGEKLDQRSDIYSLGCVLYEALVGVKVCPRSAPFESMVRHLQEEFEPICAVRPELQIPTAMEAIVKKAVEKGRTERFQSAGEFEQALLSLPAPAPVRKISLWDKLLGRR
ncbi:MAG TPA: serine/threonine-protein kinase [Chroococcales cyanobacterium]